jgi:hypothetical protein
VFDGTNISRREEEHQAALREQTRLNADRDLALRLEAEEKRSLFAPERPEDVPTWGRPIAQEHRAVLPQHLLQDYHDAVATNSLPGADAESPLPQLPLTWSQERARRLRNNETFRKRLHEDARYKRFHRRYNAWYNSFRDVDDALNERFPDTLITWDIGRRAANVYWQNAQQSYQRAATEFKREHERRHDRSDVPPPRRDRPEPQPIEIPDYEDFLTGHLRSIREAGTSNRGTS